MNDRWIKVLGVALISGVLSACGGNADTSGDPEGGPAPVEDNSQSTTGTESGSVVSSSGIGSSSSPSMHPLDDPNSLLSKKTIYFEYDSSRLLESDRSVVEAHAQYLAEHPEATLTLEGHADERGTREYNRALAEQRANSIRQLMGLLGSSGQQMRTLSYGEERPAEPGHNEEAWRWNRRVELIYRTR